MFDSLWPQAILKQQMARRMAVRRMVSSNNSNNSSSKATDKSVEWCPAYGI
jgi:hypothetical protein